MTVFVNRNLEKTEPDYFYLVREHVTTFKMDPGKNKAFTHEKKFEGSDLLKCKNEAEKYYQERMGGLEQGKYFLEFAAPQNFVPGKNSAFSITMSLVEYYNDENFIEYPLLGEDNETTADSKRTETSVLTEMGYL